jgi:hypothetical protein
MLLRNRCGDVRFVIRVLREQIVFLDQPVHLEPVVEAVLVTAVVRERMRFFLRLRSVFEENWHSRLRGGRLPGAVQVILRTAQKNRRLL